MNKIEELISKLCPNGVEYKKLGDITTISRGRILTKSQLSSNGKYPVYHGGIEPLGFYDKPNRSGDTVMVINVGASAGTVGYSPTEFWASSGRFCIEHNGLINNKYLYYCLSNVQNALQSKVRKAGIPTLNKSVLENTIIPLPPLEVQEEIVKILNNFTELTSELTSELISRRKQYEYYRDKLLTFGDGVEYKKLGDIGEVSMCKRILKSQTNAVGGIPFYKIGTFGKEPDAFISTEMFEEYKSCYSFPKKGDVLISASGTIGKTVIYDGKPAYYQDSNIVWIDNNEDVVLNKYLYYVYQLSPWRISTGGTIARLYNDNIANAKIPVPSLEEQARIVDILDRFDKLCNNFSEGLPAEIEARQKQYEYYRDKLLTFKEMS